MTKVTGVIDISINFTRKETHVMSETNNIPIYKMCLKFKLSLGLKEINAITIACGFPEKLVAENITTITLTQTVPFIPSDETLTKYAQIIKDNYESDKFTCEKCVFDGYEYIHPVTMEELIKEKEDNHD